MNAGIPWARRLLLLALVLMAPLLHTGCTLVAGAAGGATAVAVHEEMEEDEED